MSNYKKYYLFTTLYAVGFMFCSVASIQSFLLKLGFTESQIYNYNFLIKMAQVAVMVVMTFISGTIKKVKLVTGLSYLSLLAIAVLFLIGAINPSIFSASYVTAVFIVSAICYGGVGVYTIICYCLPYYIIDMKDYGRVTSVGIIFSGGTSFALSFLHTYILSKFDFFRSSACFFLLAIVCFVLTTVVCLSLKEIVKDVERKKTTKEETIAVFKNKNTYILLLPNFCRGIAAGIVELIAVVAIAKNILQEESASYLNIVMQLCMFGGNFFYAMLCKKLSTTTMLLISTLVSCAFLPFVLAQNTMWFLILFCVMYFFRLIMDTAIPVAVTEIIPKEQIGAYTSIRMLVFTGAQAVGALIIAPLVDKIGYTGLFIFASVVQLICGLGYYFVALWEKRRASVGETAQA